MHSIPAFLHSEFRLNLLSFAGNGMQEPVNYIILAIPVFFLLIGMEIIFDRLRKSGYYRLNDTISNINAGIAEQVTGVFFKVVVIGAYLWVYEYVRVATIPNNIFTWVLLFIGIDFFYYWFHRLAHEVNVLWGGHVVHHQSEEYNLSVALRQGAFQKFGSFAFYLPLALLGFDPIMFIVISQWQTIYQFWIHTKVIDKLHPVAEFILNTPSHHRAHHGRNPIYIDRNHGGTLIIWDRLFGTFQEELEPVVYGITTPLETWNPIRAQIDIWRDMGKAIRKANGWKHKAGILFRQPGWYPEELGGPIRPQPVDRQSIVKFDVAIPYWLHRYVLVQFLLILSLASYFLFTFESFPAWQQGLMAGMVIYSITAVGWLLELHRNSSWMETIRQVANVAMAILLMQSKLWSLSVGGGVILLSVAGGIWFLTKQKHLRYGVE